MVRKIKFNVIFTTDEDPDFPASELNSHGPWAYGWRSNVNCKTYPQELILKFHSPAKVSRIQVLGHQFMIPEKIELWLHNADKDSPTAPSCNFEYLGFITLSDNSSTNFKSRELQSVTVEPKIGTHLKLRLGKPFQNEFNESGQISLIAVNILGEDLTEETLDAPINDNTSICDDLSFCMYVDEGITEIVRELESKKLKAVTEERFEYARKLKLCMTTLRGAGERLGRYALAKRQAVAQEDFTTAKLRKEQMRIYQNLVFEQLEVEKLQEKNGFDAENDAISQAYVTKPVLPSPPSLQDVATILLNAQQSPRRLVHPEGISKQFSDEILHSPQLSKLGRSPCRNSPTGSLRRRNKSAPRNSYEDYEERILPTMKTECHQGGNGFESDRGRSKLNDREKRQAALPLLVFGNELVELFYSKQYQDREEGLTRLRNILKQDEPAAEFGPNKVARSATILLYRSVRDAVFSVFREAAETVRTLFADFIPKNKASASEISRSVDRLLPELLAKSGDPSARIHNLAQHTILTIASCPEVHNQNLIAPSLSRPVGSGTHPRLALSRLQMLEQLVLTQGISTDKQSGLTCRSLSESGCSGIHHPAEPVRKVAERVLLLVYKINPRLIRKQLPPDDDITRRNLLYRQLFQEFDKIDLERKNELTNGNHKGEDNDSSENGATGLSPTGRPEELGEFKGELCPFCDGICPESEDLDRHYWKSCPLLTKCPQCSLVVEVAAFSFHLANECEAKLSYDICKVCTEAVHKDLTELHREEEFCSEIPPQTTRCPLCHENILEFEWKTHFTEHPVCPGNSKRRPRK